MIDSLCWLCLEQPEFASLREGRAVLVAVHDEASSTRCLACGFPLSPPDHASAGDERLYEPPARGQG